jgi:DNA-binding Lrp family transcriptional regulator
MYDIYGKNRITGKFGDKRSYYKKGHSHQGDDIALALNSPINAVSGGKVIKIGFDPQGYGNYIDILHPNGYTSRYAHANKFNVKVGDEINEGQAIGLVGQTGRATGPHIHFEVMKDGQRVNPRDIAKYFGGETTGPLNALNTDVIKQKGIIKMADNNGVVTGAAANIEDLKREIAQNQVRERMKLTPEEEKLKEISIANIMSKLEKPIETPRYLTIQDLFNKNLDDSNIVGSFNPEVSRGINSLFGTKVYNPKTGRVEDLGEPYAQRIEAKMQNEQERALERQKLQDMLNIKAYDSMNDLEAGYMNNDLRQLLAEQNLAYQMQRDAENRAYQDRKAQEQRAWEEEKLDRAEKLKREEIAARYGGEVQADGTMTGGAANINNVKMSTADKKALSENNQTLANIEEGLKTVENNKAAFGVKGALPGYIQNFTFKKGRGARSKIDNITAVYRKWLTGAQMSDKERKDYERFLPASYDDADAIKAKLNGMKELIEAKNKTIYDGYGIDYTPTQKQNNNTGNNKDLDPMDLGL